VDTQATLFIYILEGAGTVGEPAKQVESHRAVLFGDGDEFAVQAGPDGMRFVLFAGRPLHEPIAWGGPIVMNTKAELELAFEEYRAGTFVKKRA
jgi:redox-sensitive bicupin YhaK (pirin superfamily)